jgi:carotenoid cleavage dioxygenase-like enzyme
MPETMSAPVTSRFLQGSFAPVTEEVTAFDLPVTGRVPAGLSGRYLRNGPNPLGLEDPGSHWFVGAGMVHGVRLRDGRAEWYRNRWVRSQQVATTLGEEWPAGPVHAGADFPANTHVIGHAGRILATVEAGALPYELTAELGTAGPCDFGGTLPGGFAAHTKLDPRTGELHAIAYFWAWDYVQHVVISRDGFVTRTTNIPVPDGPMMHDFALTEKYVVLFDLPVTFSLAGASAGLKLPYTWNPAHQARVGLLARDGRPAQVRWFEVEPCWVFHSLNAYDDQDGRVVVDVVQYAGAYDVSRLSGKGPITLDRWTPEPAAGRVARRRLDDRLQEFPRVDERVISRPHRYG